MESKSNSPSWQSKVLEKPRMGFVAEQRFRLEQAAQAAAARPPRRDPRVPVEIVKPDPLAKIVNETRIGFVARVSGKKS